MADAVSVLAAGGIQRPADVITLAAAAGLELAAAAVMLIKESGGGRMVWGSDPVSTGGVYTKGGPVTQDNYLAYRSLVQAGKIGRQGVGATQITWGGYQDQADQRGGCWDFRANCSVGFEALAGLIRDHGEHDGFARYNGSGPAAQRYADDAMARLAVWRARLAGTGDGPGGLPTVKLGDRGPAVAHLQAFCNAYDWQPALPLLPVTGFYGPQTQHVIAGAQAQMGVTGPDADGSTCGPRTNAGLWARGYRGLAKGEQGAGSVQPDGLRPRVPDDDPAATDPSAGKHLLQHPTAGIVVDGQHSAGTARG